MRYVVYEAGSRAGLSALMFFEHFQKITGRKDVLYLVDSDKVFVETISRENTHVIAVEEDVWNDNLLAGSKFVLDSNVFPADELSRQKGCRLAHEWWNSVCPEFYNKQYVNTQMEVHGISVPRTFKISKNVIVKPNSMSAGSKNLCMFDGVCVSERIDIAHEYVVDCFYNPITGEKEIHCREVRLKNGYDKYIKFLPQDHPVVEYAASILAEQPVYGMFVGPCHIQVAEDDLGCLYYIEGSKRISGTSLVFLLKGYNPFFGINGEKFDMIPVVKHGEWHSYEQLMQQAWRMVYE